jgi:hypothetical protein
MDHGRHITKHLVAPVTALFLLQIDLFHLFAHSLLLWRAGIRPGWEILALWQIDRLGGLLVEVRFDGDEGQRRFSKIGCVQSCAFIVDNA